MLTDTAEIYNRVVDLKVKSGKTPDEIAAGTGLPLSTVKNYFAGGGGKQPGLLTVCQIIDFLGGSVDHILDISHTDAHSGVSQHHVRFLEHELHIQRTEKHRWQWAFLFMVGVLLTILFIDLFNPGRGWIQYAAEMSGYIKQGFSSVFGSGGVQL